MSLRTLSLKRKLTAISMVATSAALLVACVAFLSYDYVTFREQQLRNLQTLGDLIAADTTAALSFDDERSARAEILYSRSRQGAARADAVRL